MSVIVQKYGGSSVADTVRLKAVAERIAETKREGHQVVVVVSAMGDTTDQLLALAREVSSDPPRRELDMLLTAGERISMAVLSMAMQELGFESISFTGSQSGILTNDRHTDARILEVRPYRIQDEIERGKIVIVAGFQGVSYRREVTTLGRGGSDTTAVALAAALDAERCEIYSDVDGVYSADPRVVSQARHLAEISYEEMQDLALSGARVLNAEAIEFAKRAGIVIYARATSNGRRETRVVVGGPPRQAAAGVAGNGRLVRLTMQRAEGVREHFDGLTSTLREWDVTPSFISLGERAAEVVISHEQCPDLDRLLAQCAERFGDRLGVDRDIASVSVVGSGVGNNPRSLARALELFRQSQLPVLGMHTSSLRFSILTGAPHCDAGVRLLHQEFVERD